MPLATEPQHYQQQSSSVRMTEAAAAIAITAAPAPISSSSPSSLSFDSTDSRLSLKASLLAHLLYQIKSSQYKTRQQLLALVDSQPPPPPAAAAVPEPASSASSSSIHLPTSPLDDALTRIVFLQQYFCCLSAHLRHMGRRRQDDSQRSAAAKLSQADSAQEQCDAYVRLIAEVVGMITAAPALPHAADFITVSLPAAHPPTAAAGTASSSSARAPLPAASPSSSSLRSRRPATSPSSSASPRPAHLSASAASSPSASSTGAHSRSSSSAFSASPRSLSPPASSSLHLVSGSSKSTITAPPSVTFTRGRWTSISSLAGLQGKEEGDETVDALDAIDDWADDDTAATTAAKASNAQAAADSGAQEEQKARSSAVVLVSASQAELGDLDDEDLDVSRVERLRERQRQEQERQVEQVKMLNGRWVKRAMQAGEGEGKEADEEEKAAVGNELDDIPDFADDETVAPSILPSSSSSFSSFSRSSPPLSSSASTTSHSHTSSASSIHLQSIVDEMSDDSVAPSPTFRSQQSRVTVQEFDRLAAGIRVLKVSSDGQLQPRTLRLLPSTLPTVFSPTASFPYHLRWGQSRSQPNLMQLSLSSLALHAGRSSGHFPSLPLVETQRLKEGDACFSASNDRLCLSVVCEGGREERDLMLRAIRQRQRDWGGLHSGWQQQQKQQPAAQDGKQSEAEESKWEATQADREEEEQEESEAGEQAVEQQQEQRRQEDDDEEVNRRSSVIRDEDVQSVLELSLSVEDDASHSLRAVITADEQDDLAAWQDDAEHDDVPLPLPSPALPSSSSPSASSFSTSGRSAEELREFDVSTDWLQAMQAEAAEYAGRRPPLSTAGPAVPAVSWEQLREFARLYHAEVDGSEMDDICDHDDAEDDAGDGDDDDGGEDDEVEDDEDDAEMTEEAASALQAKLNSMKAAAAVQAEDEDVDWGDAG